MNRNQQEYRLHCWVADMLTRFAARDVVWFHVPNGEYRTPETARRLKRMGVLAGVGDLVFIQPGPLVSFLELKAPGEGPSDTQQAFGARVLACGCRYAVADSGDAAIEILQSWGVISQRVRVAA